MPVEPARAKKEPLVFEVSETSFQIGRFNGYFFAQNLLKRLMNLPELIDRHRRECLDRIECGALGAAGRA